MKTAIVLEEASQIGLSLRWPLRIAALWGQEIVLVVPHVEACEIDLSLPNDSPTPELAVAVVELLERYVGAESWCPASKVDEQTESRRSSVRLKLVPPDSELEQGLALLDNRGDDRLVLVTQGERGHDKMWQRANARLLTGTNCEVIYVRPGRREIDGQLFVGTARSHSARAAIQLAEKLANAVERPLTGVYVEPDIGPDALGVGQRLLERRLRSAIDERAAQVERRVEIANRPEIGILRACEDDQCEVIILGASHLGALGAQPRGVPYKVHRATEEPTVVFVRARIPLAGRIRRLLDFELGRRVPQLSRDERSDLVTRIQSNSKWNFDFVMLVGLSTLIATLGLIDDSVAVIIGAMLVAPLMTPLLGIGLALSQGNPRLATMSLKAVALGFVTAFLLALLVGHSSPGFLQATPAMAERDWPQVLDLIVAFVSGLAAAYASGRTGLLAALPGVAIAAAVLPPIATSGLAVSIGDLDLALGSLLLFSVNLVAITLAAAVSLWAVGMRRLRAPTLTTRILGTVLVGSAIAMTIGLVALPARLDPPTELVHAVETKLGDEIRLRHIRLRKEAGGQVVQIDVGGAQTPSPTLADELRDLAGEYLGDDVGVRLTFRYEVLAR